ncbi:hypothetical protein HDU86_002914 [Geranomyces michiganensis]|nr:hypothetical protein HDU86_002914 [Geranomyces michiganensis]
MPAAADTPFQTEMRETGASGHRPRGETHVIPRSNTLRRKSLSRPEVHQHSRPSPLLRTHTTRSTRRMLAGPIVAADEPAMEAWEAWNLFSRACTCCIPAAFLNCCSIKGKGTQQAWREKVTLCLLFALLSAAVMFFLVGLNPLMCPSSARMEFAPINGRGTLVIQGRIYSLAGAGPKIIAKFPDAQGQDASDFFALPPHPACDGLNTNNFPFARADVGPTCQFTDSCFDISSLTLLTRLNDGTQVNPTASYDWTKIKNADFFVYKDQIINLAPYFRLTPNKLNRVDNLLRYLQGDHITDATHAIQTSRDLGSSSAARQCLEQKFFAGRIAEDSVSCIFALMISIIVAIVVLSVMFARFAMAIMFDWFVSHRLAQTPQDPAAAASSKFMMDSTASLVPKKGGASSGRLLEQQTTTMHATAAASEGFDYDSDSSANNNRLRKKGPGGGRALAAAGPHTMDVASIGLDLYTILLVTCYSEGEASLRTTIESLASTEYPAARKLLFIIADGVVTGKGNAKSTPDLLLEMIELDGAFGTEPKPYSYIAVASGSKGHNMARVYIGHYIVGGGGGAGEGPAQRVPTILVVKCGTPEESQDAKPGNRGKRDSQLILMHWLQRVMLADRMTPLDFDLFRKSTHLMGVTPDHFEIVLMVDADTKVAHDSLRLMVNAMHNDDRIMGLCGETRISNKTQSWVTTIQVFEYYISHHLGKAFESVFGGVTCLPGCFCMYRIKSRKANGDWVPILCNPDVVETYSTNEVETLHQKNLLLLGEDRFLTTMMLRTFPNRKMVFIPRAVCKTVVPDDFATLLSQRRRWINSTIHNLAELVTVNNLCGTFCFSMQFVVLLDLISTAVLPASIVSAIYIIINLSLKAASEGIAPGSYYTIATLALVMFFPSLIVVLSFRRYQYILWLVVYLFALPVWNLVLPLYAFWHFDDFSWGATRQVEGGDGGGGHGGGSKGVFDGSKVSLRRYEDYQRAWMRRRAGNATAAATNNQMRRMQQQGNPQQQQQQQQQQHPFASSLSSSASSTTLANGGGGLPFVNSAQQRQLLPSSSAASFDFYGTSTPPGSIRSRGSVDTLTTYHQQQQQPGSNQSSPGRYGLNAFAVPMRSSSSQSSLAAAVLGAGGGGIAAFGGGGGDSAAAQTTQSPLAAIPAVYPSSSASTASSSAGSSSAAAAAPPRSPHLRHSTSIDGGSFTLTPDENALPVTANSSRSGSLRSLLPHHQQQQQRRAGGGGGNGVPSP